MNVCLEMIKWQKSLTSEFDDTNIGNSDGWQNMTNLGRLKKSRIREIWTKENDFSDWLYDKNNISLLSESLGLNDIQPANREEGVGDFRADIFAEESNTGRKIVIENQFESSNHEHLGKIITYAAGKDAEIVIWIVEQAREEHSSAVDWLNRHLDVGIGFFLIEIELWRIGDSLPAPKFNVIAKPNVWMQTEREGLDETRKFKLSIWQQFVAYAAKNQKLLRSFPGTQNRKGSPDHWFPLQKGCKGYSINLLIFTRSGKLEKIGAEIQISDDKELYYKFEKNKIPIESALGLNAEWYPLPDKKSSYVRIIKEIEEGKSEGFEPYFEWLSDMAILLKEVFNKYSNLE